MTPLRLILDGDGAFNDCPSIQFGQIDRITRLVGGTASGKSSIAIGIRLGDGTMVVGETTMALFLSAAAAMKAADERDGISHED